MVLFCGPHLPRLDFSRKRTGNRVSHDTWIELPGINSKEMPTHWYFRLERRIPGPLSVSLVHLPPGLSSHGSHRPGLAPAGSSQMGGSNGMKGPEIKFRSD